MRASSTGDDRYADTPLALLQSSARVRAGEGFVKTGGVVRGQLFRRFAVPGNEGPSSSPSLVRFECGALQHTMPRLPDP